jgi:hypothetical protein
LADGTDTVTRQENHHHHPPHHHQLDATHKQDQKHSYTRENSRFCSLNLDERVAFLARLNEMVLDGFSRRLPRTDLIPAVHQFNMIAALAANAASLRLSLESLRHDIPSPFTISGPSSLPPLSTRAWVLPTSLQPTDLQKKIPHHPWIDLCPMPSVRDTLLLHMGQFDEDELCHDLFDSCGGAASNNNNTLGMVVWGEPSDPAAYEISEEVVRKWSWAFGDAQVLRHTNSWRRKRGECSLFLPQNLQSQRKQDTRWRGGRERDRGRHV